MTTIDTSGIDQTKPTEGTATTQSVRDNFTAIKTQLGNAGTDIDGISADLASTASGNGSELVGYKQSGTGASAQTVSSRLQKEIYADDYSTIQEAIDYAVTLVTAGQSATVIIDGDPTFSNTLTVPVNSGRIPNIDCRGLLHYTGGDTQPAIVIGEAGEVVTAAHINIAVTNDNQSDWTQPECIGVRIINANACPNIIIRESTNFTTGVECAGNGSGFVYSNVFLGSHVNCKYGLDLKPSLSGWVNENNFMGGRFGVFTGVNSTVARYGIRVGRSGESQANNNTFLKPSFELNVADVGAGLTVGLTFEDALQNHVINCRSEGTEIVAEFDSGSFENEVIIGYSNSSSHGVTDNGSAGNIVKYSRKIYEYAGKVIYDANDLKSKAALRSSSVATIAGLMGVNTTTGAQTYYGSDLTIGTEDITILSGSIAYGVIVDTSEQKSFVFSGGYTGNGGLLHVVCYDAVDAIITTAGSATGTANNPLSASGQGFQSGSDSTNNVSVKFSSAVKRAFIGVRKGTLNPQLNGFRILAIDDPDYIAKPAILTKTPTHSLNPNHVWSNQAPTAGTWKQGDRVYNVTPSVDGNNMVLDHWVCTVAGTSGTWVAQYISTVSPAT